MTAVIPRRLLALVLGAIALTGCSTPWPGVSERPWNQPTRAELYRDVRFWWGCPEWSSFDWDPIRNTPSHWP